MKFKWLKRIWFKANPKYKDRLFCTIFGKEKYKKYALDLYNAVNGSNYGYNKLHDLEIISLDDAVYIKMKNDVAYLMKEYSYFVDRVRKNKQHMSAEKAVDEAVKECIANNYLKDVLEEERAAVMLEMLTEFDEKAYEEGLREEGRKEGREEERKKTEAAEKRADAAEAELAKYKEKYGDLV